MPRDRPSLHPPEPVAPIAVSDSQLVESLRRGDLEAFERMFAEYHALLCEIADAYVDSQAIAEELVQDLFYAIWRDRSTLEVRQSLRSYLCRATRNRALQHLRHRSVAQRWAQQADVESGPSRPSASDAELEQQETLEALRAAIATLPPRGRLAIVLRWRHGMSNADVADAMGISVKGVEKLLASSMVKLRIAMRTHREAR